nr:activating transcription factor of chaperone isoform X1 [Onthophagus taurus]
MEDSPVLIMEWKEEPLSPIFADELTAVPSDEDARFYWTESSEQCDVEKNSLQYAEILLGNAPAIAAQRNSSSTKAEPIDDSLLQNLEELEDLSEWIIEESSFPWLEDQIGFTTIEQKYATEDLLQEFENVLEAVNPGALTPPQSPPREPQPPPILTTLEPITVGQIYPVYTTTAQKLDDCPKTPQTIAHELAVVDELVRARANDILCESPPSPSTSNSGSFDDSSSSSEDPEWIPETVIESEKSSARRRYKPYKISPVDKKNRKKEQNKNAATRYRLKKKAEVEEILNEEKGVLKENEDLTSKISDLQREIRYLKGLMRDLFKAKGIIQ